MRFTVIWDPPAEADLARLWLDHPTDRESIRQAADTIDRVLRDDPQTHGRPFGAHRQLVEWPLVAAFRIEEGDRKVHILRLRYLGGWSPSPNGQGSH